MEQLTSVWAALDMRRKVIVAGATVLVFAAVLGLARMASQPSMALLYSGLEAGPAGDVIAALEAQGVAHEIRGGAIYVDSAARDGLRMTLASEGLPANSSKGYELLDGLSGFGTTSQMFDAAYWRAKEGELARTIMSAPHIQTARVHIATPGSQGLRPRGAPTASVSVSTADGSLSPAHAKALKYLVASAVPALSPDDVSIIDARGGLIQGADEVASVDAADRAEMLKTSVERLLEARVGYGNAIVEVAIDTAQENETIRERLIDPEGRVAISTDTVETANTANESGNAGVTVASNLPTGDGAGADASSSSNASETRERVNYEVSETMREVTRGPGTVRRLTVAVLVDGLREVDAAGDPVWTPRSDEELGALRDLVAGAVGYDESRGDTITIKTMEFEPIMPVGTEATPGLFARLGLDAMALAKVLVLALVTLVLGLFVLRPALLGRGESNAESLPAPEATVEDTDLPALDGEIEMGAFDGSDLAVVSDFDFGDDGALPALGEPDPVDRLRRLIEERQAETVEILRGWMEDDQEENA
ncbi:flagellar basal-body MS-ring/collar protein FliF [Maritimibacter sp. UBA3975]|uniref:flagellar basal-body MS-ring/collar protein FliF n=1 Tax=Maritimibacter sp. UBA3975 TaxID=1946833 RepID=UPI000C0B109E|nr:flagellar basal-body MS-ring/collar protein FliF [Maritimibacter sp. UBA3975]MAM61862.1 flagellar M-ring protein FliF [Maritimibacter sp.]